jgi:hypothetical protein
MSTNRAQIVLLTIIALLLAAIAAGTWLRPQQASTPNVSATLSQETEKAIVRCIERTCAHSEKELARTLEAYQGLTASLEKTAQAHFLEGLDAARLSNLISSLQTIRSQLMLYKVQHEEKYPNQHFVDQMTQHTDADGNVSATPDTEYPYGPYLQSIPVNPVSGDNTVTVVHDEDTVFSAPEDDAGWWFNPATGEFRANLTDQHVDDKGIPLNTY